MKISQAILGFVATSLSMQGMAQDRDRDGRHRIITPDSAPNSRPPRFSSQPTWHEVCLKYNAEDNVIISGRFGGVCDASESRVGRNGERRTYCPEGTIKALLEQPLISCVQPAIL